MNVRRFTIAVFAAGLFLFARAGLAVDYTVDETTIAAFGDVGQNQVGPNGTSGNNFCAPTATINSFTWLTNAYPGTYGDLLMGGQATWVAAGQLLAGGNFMQTDPNTGTSVANWINGKYNYIQTYAPGSTIFQGMSSLGTGGQPWVQAANPTANFLLQMLQYGEDVEIGIVPAAGGTGHVLTLSSIDWDDANNNSIFDAGDTLSIDGLDPAGSDGLGTSASTFDLDLSPATVAGGPLTVSGGDGGVYNGYALKVALAESPVPEPATLSLFFAGCGAAALLRRLRRHAA
ncbi:MAG: PEP-CTERM sorting domain-containing protein [Candidatus Brocadiia bacterium]